MYDFILSELSNLNILLFHMINQGMGNVLFDFIMPLITDLGSFLAWILICVFLFLFGGKNGRRVAVLALAALFMSNVIVYLLKIIVALPRPFLVLPDVDVLVSVNEIYSFPSGHSASSFAAALVIGLRYKLNFREKSYGLIYPLLAFAVIIGFSRIYIGVHYPFDVLFGALVGIFSALLILKVEDNKIVDKLTHIPLLDKLTLKRIKNFFT
jgi:undecaprenyl-diphosphatase